MRKIDKVLSYLGNPYTIARIDNEDVVYRNLGNGYDFEVSGIHSGSESYTLYVWKLTPHREIVGIYSRIYGAEQLKDALGHYAFKYQNLSEKIQVEREDSLK